MSMDVHGNAQGHADGDTYTHTYIHTYMQQDRGCGACRMCNGMLIRMRCADSEMGALHFFSN